MTLQGMTQAKWDSLTPAQRDVLRDTRGLKSSPLHGYAGWRVEVVDEPGDKPRRFNVGQSTGWMPCYLEIARVNCYGGNAARQSYASIRRIRKVA